MIYSFQYRGRLYAAIGWFRKDERTPEFHGSGHLRWWLQEGPPKPKWRIVREFPHKPTHVVLDAWLAPEPLTDADVEVTR